MDICSYWVGIGQGGPQLHPAQMRELGALGLAVWWDIYFEAEERLARAIESVAAEASDGTKREIVERVLSKIREADLERYGDSVVALRVSQL
jgi:hypothetical protein